ncbi:hypothetical protein BCR44DRAFT_1461039 [Catenaria anguillulae PL171]|uniref:HECT-type E3 ubiquitin transferase n=1 Tax=Catenaria anguillulae PL171 TaxID=765915 RepID=A0A1Y2HPT7_9FUNG|nr:hypothetical protein BCR44DRAFT_1461039 [Catenaria anguillulae PL171]
MCELLHRLPSSTHPEVARWILAHKGTPNRAQGVLVIQRLVAGIHATISACFRPCSNLEDVDDENEDEGAVVDPGAVHAIKALKVIDTINRKYSLLPYATFYHPDINAYFSPRAEYLRWKSSPPVSAMNEPQPLALAHYPFILNPASKSDLLRIESLVHMRHHLQATFFRALFVGVQSPYLDLVVRRDHAVRDTLVQLAGVSDRRDLRKQLRVSFVGEPGVDEGGVARELLALVMRGLLDPVYGMFAAAGAGDAVAWFVPDVVAFSGQTTSDVPADNVESGASSDARTEEEYELAGKVCGVALYNSIVLQVHFPLVLFKKLLGEPLTIDDLAEIDPQLAQGMRTLANFQGDVQSTYCRTFTVEEERLGGGARTVVELIPNGASVDLTNDNRKLYMEKLLDYHLNVRVSRSFQAFQRGFAAVTAESSIKHLFRAEELHHVVLGEDELDIDALETQAIYDGGYSHETPIVESLWHAIRSMSKVDQRRFLFFVTGSDRSPVGGLGRVTVVVMRQGPDSDRLPSAHTCFNVLLLPEYSSPSKLETLLQKALENIEGFGLM